jgi:ubiquinone/menaquinone biosynthesis C-methylase UbiE
LFGGDQIPVNQRPIHFRTSFNQTADDYDAVRPGYPTELINDIVTLAALPSPASILEIGCGTGQATMPFAQRGNHLTCLDIGAALLTIARPKFTTYPNMQFQHTAFEAWPAQPSTFDLVMSATAFHWIPPEIGYPKAATVLKDSGCLAIFSNEHRLDAPEFAADLYQIEQRLVPWWPDPRTPPNFAADIAETAASINATGRFTPVIVKTYPWAQTYTTPTYLRLLNTYSNYRNLDEPTRTQLFHAIAELIDQRYAGTMTKSYLAVLYLAHK